MLSLIESIISMSRAYNPFNAVLFAAISARDPENLVSNASSTAHGTVDSLHASVYSIPAPEVLTGVAQPCTLVR